MTVLSVVQGASLSLGLEYPSILFASTTRTWQEMQELVNECAAQIFEAYDWSILKKTATLTGDGVATSFALPADYDRMVKDANIWGPSMTFYTAQQVLNFNEWLELLTYSPESWVPRWSVFGGAINLLPIAEAGDVYSYGYISNQIVTPADIGQPKTTKFTADYDSFVLDERLLKLSVIWNWKKSKGQDYASELAEYEEAKGRLTFKDGGSRPTLISGRSGYRFPTGQTVP